jgi:hypothetical protein
MNTSIVGNGIDVVVRANDGAVVRNWMSYNSEWLGAFEAKIWWCSRAETGAFVVKSFPENDGDDHESGEGFPEASTKPILYLSADWVLKSDWISYIGQAYALRPFWTATGRLIVQGAGGPPDLTDQTPRRIAKDVKEWFFNPEMHGVVAQKLPDDVLWISPRASGWNLTLGAHV